MNSQLSLSLSLSQPLTWQIQRYFSHRGPLSLLYSVSLGCKMEGKIKEDASATVITTATGGVVPEGTLKQGGVSIGRAMERRVMRDGAWQLRKELINSRVRVAGKDKMIRWEHILPQNFIRILVVENDYSTRQILCALLKKCNYQVVAVADGLKAWAVLKEKHYDFDLVLTEVVMPSLSGIDLLSKIMSNEICKKIPVIMMSSYDSIGIVFKCMTRGATDFLVKPVRKNELRNLWQHVWRKYCRKLEVVCENEVAGHNGTAFSGYRSKTGDGSDGVIDTEGWEFRQEHYHPKDRLQPMRDQMSKPYAKRSTFINKSSCHTPEAEIESMQEQGEPLENEHRSFPKETDTQREISIQETTSIKTMEEGVDIDPESLDHMEGTKEPKMEIINFIGTAITGRHSFPVLEDKTIKSSDEKSIYCSLGSLPLRELSLKVPQLKGQDEGVLQEKQHVLNHSDVSAFSRYGNRRIHLSHPSSTSSASLCIKTSESGAANCHLLSGTGHGKNVPFSLMEKLISHHGNVGEALSYFQLSSGSNKEDVDHSSSVILKENTYAVHTSTQERVFPHPQLGFMPLRISVGAVPFQSFFAGYGSILSPSLHEEHFIPQCSSSNAEKETEVFCSNPDHYYNHLINNCHIINCHLCVKKHHPHQLMQGMEEQKAKIKYTHPRIELSASLEIVNQIGHCSCGITHASGSNGNNWDASGAVKTGVSLEPGNEDGFQDYPKIGFDCGHAQREVALTRFRLKRKDRCFEKKVRYQNRKKFAEKRPRLKGQFICQAESTT